MDITILFPVLNEQRRLERGIETTVRYMRENSPIPFKILIMDNGSEDETPKLGQGLAQKYAEVSYVRVGARGVGVAFRKGVELNESQLVGYMDIDLSTDIRYLGKAIKIFRSDSGIEYINGSRFHKKSRTRGRKWYRKITSQGLLFLLKMIFGMRSSDAICGFTFMRREVARRLVAGSSDDNGWFYMIELLLRAERSGVRILDMPVRWKEDYDTTVKICKTVKNYTIQIARLYRVFRKEERDAEKN